MRSTEVSTTVTTALFVASPRPLLRCQHCNEMGDNLLTGKLCCAVASGIPASEAMRIPFGSSTMAGNRVRCCACGGSGKVMARQQR